MSDNIKVEVLYCGNNVKMRQEIPGDWTVHYTKIFFYLLYPGGFAGMPEVYINGKLVLDDTVSFKVWSTKNSREFYS